MQGEAEGGKITLCISYMTRSCVNWLQRRRQCTSASQAYILRAATNTHSNKHAQQQMQDNKAQ